MKLGILGFGQFLGTNPYWLSTDDRPPTALQAAIELRSPLLHGLQVGKIAHLTSIAESGLRPPTNYGGDEGQDQRDPTFRGFFAKLQGAERAIKGARERLHANPAPFQNRRWRPAFERLAAREWSLLLDGLYAAYVATYPLPDTDEDMIAVARVGVGGASNYLAGSLGSRVQAQQVEEELIAAAQAFHRNLTRTPA